MKGNSLIRIVAWVLAVAASCWIAWLVFNFGYYASGLAAHKEQEKLRRETPIQTEFADPKVPDPNKPDPNSP